jgi:2,3-bisphosphoglycerate-dependent phosphoglycerate mutase
MASSLESIVLIRHARSVANTDPRIYRTTPDHAIPLIDPEGDADALRAAQWLRDMDIDAPSACAWNSPYLRCKQTRDLIVRHAFDDGSALAQRESFLLREQEFGDWDGFSDVEIAEYDPARWRRLQRMSDLLGRFYFRFPNGESRADVVTRVTLFIAKLHRSRFSHHLVFLHGVTQRAFRMSWFNRPIEWFESEKNPANASVVAIRRGDDGQWFEESWSP